MNKVISQPASKQALWFLLVGGCAAGVHFLVLLGVVSLTTITPIWANAIAFLVAFIVSFSGHFYLTFNQAGLNKKNAMLPILAKWFASSAIGFAANQSLFVLGINWLGERYYLLVWFVITGIITVMTFVLGKLWAFKS